MNKTDSKFTKSIIAIIPIIIALIALLHSTGILTKFKLDVNVDGYLIPHSSIPNERIVSFPIIIPIIFSNSGNRSGVIEDVVLVVEKIDTKEKQIYSPISEIDLQKLINGKRVVHAENIISPNFHPFRLTGNESCIKSILFTQDISVKGFPGYPTGKGKYLIKLLVKTNKKKYRNVFEFELDLNEDLLNDYNSGTSIYTGRINFPYNDFEIPK